MRGQVRIDLEKLASKQHGVVTRNQLLSAGFSSKEIERRTETGLLLRVHRGVFRVGHRAPSIEATYLAAVLACGAGAVLSGRPAAHLHGLIKGRPPPPEVAAPTERRVPGVTTRHSKLDQRDVSDARGIPVTTVPRTLVDLAPVLDLDALARACHEAGVRYRTTPSQVKAVLARRPRAPGGSKLQGVMSGDVPVSLSKLEKRFLDLLRKAGLPLPETNRPAGSYRVDCRWPEYRLTVELDSYRFHNSRHSWRQDRIRKREARARGDEFFSYDWDDVEEERAILRELGPILSGPPIGRP
jgi:hypothetical protein